MSYQQQASQWESGLCDCFQDCGLCCDVLLCTCCQAGRIYEAADEKPDEMNVPVCCGLLICTYFLGVIPQCIFTMCMRDKVRGKYGIMGSGCGDCCAACFCTTCAMCQLHKELSKRGKTPGYVCCSPSVSYPQLQHGKVQPGYNTGV